MKNILCIEDDLATAEQIRGRLEPAGFNVRCVHDGAQGLALALAERFDLITLDRMLPGMDGLSVVQALRDAGVATPVIMISGMDSVDERLEGLRAGGDEYLVKPIQPEEMVARVQVVLRRHAEAPRPVTRLECADLRLSLITREASCKDQVLSLKPTEFRLLAFLMRNAGQVVSRSMIFESVWGYHFDPGTKLIDVQLTRLRKMLENMGSRVRIETMRGAGFRLHD
ncbi:response regulator transcription factor [Pseudomonas fulva]|nr:response regulator transcription factor [Pseudomonas fulva]MBF8778110.1 response regulator transcription factor [Pseudomonas fulva]